ncbi:hypothetical protein D3C75_371540 [compost metagenome]
MNLSNEAVIVHFNPQAGIMLRLKLVNCFVDKRDVSSFFQMVLEDILQINGINMLASRENDVFSRCSFEKIKIVMVMLEVTD